MPVPTANTLRFSDVCLETYLNSSTSGRTLMTAFLDASLSGFNSAYATGSDSLLAFRGYDNASGGGGLPSGGNEILLGVSEDNKSVCLERSSAYYSDAASLYNSTVLYKVYGQTDPSFLALSNWYSDGVHIRYWNGSGFEGEISGCYGPL